MKQNLQVCLLSMACLMFLTPNITVAQTFKEEVKPELSQPQKLEHACLGKSCECGANGKIKVEGKSESLSSPDFATLRFTVTPTPDNNKTADIVDTFVKNLDAANVMLSAKTRFGFKAIQEYNLTEAKKAYPEEF